MIDPDSVIFPDKLSAVRIMDHPIRRPIRFIGKSSIRNDRADGNILQIIGDCTDAGVAEPQELRGLKAPAQLYIKTPFT